MAGGDIPPVGGSDSARYRTPPVPVPRAPQESVPPADGEDKPAVDAGKRLHGVVTRREDGVQQVAVVDKVTGETISETPSDAVLHVVDTALWQLRMRKEGQA
jgi:hypothetical protein